jgi:hypothetical protein
LISEKIFGAGCSWQIEGGFRQTPSYNKRLFSICCELLLAKIVGWSKDPVLMDWDVTTLCPLLTYVKAGL